MHKLMSRLVLIAAMIVCLLLLQSVSHACAVSEEARRHMARGQAAVEMAKSPVELEDAIKEFQEASRLAPNWPDPYYNLAILQEKTGKLKEAVASLKQYLRLAPNAPDAAKIQEHIYKLEYKAEQVLTVPEIIDVLVSGFQYSEEWEDSLLVKTGDSNCGGLQSAVSFQREGVDTVRALLGHYNGRPLRQYFQTLKVTGPILRYITTVNVCSLDANEGLGGCDIVQENEVEIVSKRLIKVNRKVIGTVTMKGASTQKGDIESCTFRKK